MALRPDKTDKSSTVPATREDAQQEGFMREVDEALRQDEALDLFKRYATPIGFAVAAGLAAFGGYLGWSHYQTRVSEDRAIAFVKSLDQLQAGNLDAASKGLEPLAREGGDGSQAAAAMLRAGIASEQGKSADAAKGFAAVAADANAPQPYRDLARIREVALRFDAMPPDQVIAAMKPLALPGKPWFGSAGELMGLAYLKQGRGDLAGPLFASIARDKAVPSSLRMRSRQMAGVLGVDAVDDVNKAAAETAAGADGGAQ